MEGEEIFQTIPELTQFSQEEENHINLTPKFLCISFLTTLPHFLLSNLVILKVFPKAFSTGMKPSKCPALTRLWQCSEVFRKLSEIFGSHQDVSGNPSHDKVKSLAFESEKVGRYKTTQLDLHMDK